MNSAEVKRRTENFICTRLKTEIGNHPFHPWKGGHAQGDAIEVIPPFTVIGITEAEKLVEFEGTWRCRGVAQVVNHAAQSSSPAHSALVDRIYRALGNLNPFTSDQFVFHGIDITELRNAESESADAWVDIIEFTCGVSA